MRVVKQDAKLHPTLNDVYDTPHMLSDFEHSMPLKDLLYCGDSAALLVANSSYCGYAFIGRTSSCSSLSVTMKRCATGGYT